MATPYPGRVQGSPQSSKQLSQVQVRRRREHSGNTVLAKDSKWERTDLTWKLLAAISLPQSPHLQCEHSACLMEVLSGLSKQPLHTRGRMRITVYHTGEETGLERANDSWCRTRL